MNLFQTVITASKTSKLLYLSPIQDRIWLLNVKEKLIKTITTILRNNTIPAKAWMDPTRYLTLKKYWEVSEPKKSAGLVTMKQ